MVEAASPGLLVTPSRAVMFRVSSLLDSLSRSGSAGHSLLGLAACPTPRLSCYHYSEVCKVPVHLPPLISGLFPARPRSATTDNW
jgi:hypothetical protein